MLATVVRVADSQLSFFGNLSLAFREREHGLVFRFDHLQKLRLIFLGPDNKPPGG